MPIYKVQCTKCGKIFEKLTFTVDKLPICSCGGKTERLPTTAAFAFKGEGFHRTDYPSMDQVVGEVSEKAWMDRINRWEQKKKLQESCAPGETVVMNDDFTYEKVSSKEVPQLPDKLERILPKAEKVESS